MDVRNEFHGNVPARRMNIQCWKTNVGGKRNWRFFYPPIYSVQPGSHRKEGSSPLRPSAFFCGAFLQYASLYFSSVAAAVGCNTTTTRYGLNTSNPTSYRFFVRFDEKSTQRKDPPPPCGVYSSIAIPWGQLKSCPNIPGPKCGGQP